MNIVLDSNVLFSALIRDALSRRLILEYEGAFLFPAFIFEEMEKHQGMLLQKSGMSERDFQLLLGVLLRKVAIVPSEALLPYRQRAWEAVKTIDPDDVLFIACALAYPGGILWSDDRRLRRQDAVTVMNTGEIRDVICGRR